VYKHGVVDALLNDNPYGIEGQEMKRVIGIKEIFFPSRINALYVSFPHHRRSPTIVVENKWQGE